MKHDLQLPHEVGADRFGVAGATPSVHRELGFEVCCNGVRPGQAVEWGEWLFDMCWLERDDRAECYIHKSMPFAMECEWDLPVKHHVLPDF